MSMAARRERAESGWSSTMDSMWFRRVCSAEGVHDVGHSIESAAARMRSMGAKVGFMAVKKGSASARRDCKDSKKLCGSILLALWVPVGRPALLSYAVLAWEGV